MEQNRMFKYAICNETFQDWTWERTCVQVAELGYSSLEIAPFTLSEDIRTLSPSDRKSRVAFAHQLGLNIAGLHWLLVSPIGLSITSDDLAVRKETISYLCHLVDLCADLGGRVMVLGSPAQRRLPTLAPHADPITAREIAVARLEQVLLPVLLRTQKANITLCLEPLPPPEADFITTLQEAVDIVARIQHPHLKTILDVKSASTEQESIPTLLRNFAPYIAHVHANDANRRGPGFGQTDFLPIISALQSVNYTGVVSVEVFDYAPDPVTIARESLGYLHQCEQQSHSTSQMNEIKR